jgi:hypothetical protein
VPVDVIQPLLEGTRALVYVVFTTIGAGCFAVGYVIWDYRRKRGAIKKHDKSDAQPFAGASLKPHWNFPRATCARR